MIVNVPRVLKLFILPNAVFVGLALILAPAVLISGLNAVIVALATGVVVSFAVDAFKIIAGHKTMGKAHWMVLGITTHWAGTDGARIWSIIWRWLDQPMWMANSHFVSYFLFLNAVGAYFHLAASESIGEERIPRAKWVRYGALVAAAIFAAITVGAVVDHYSQAGFLNRAFG